MIAGMTLSALIGDDDCDCNRDYDRSEIIMTSSYWERMTYYIILIELMILVISSLAGHVACL